MSKVKDISIYKEIAVDKNHIDNYELEINTGTKRVRANFYKNAVGQRNNYTRKQQVIFSKYKVNIENEMADRVKKMFPKDRSKYFNKELEKVSNLLEIVKLNTNISDSFKLKLDFIIAEISDDTTLDELNSIIKNFLDAFMKFEIKLTLDDFKYSMFTEKYMEPFLANSSTDVMKEVFESIYFSCPDIKLQLKMNLRDIVFKYKNKLEKCVKKIKNDLITDDTDFDKAVSEYSDYRNSVGSKIAEDVYYNTKLFLDGKRNINDFLPGAPIRVKNYDLFAVNGAYEELNDASKKSYDSATMGLYLSLNELKKYYKYEFIIEDLLKRYKEKDGVKNSYQAKKKEIEKEEKNRLSIYKEYLKATGVGFFAKSNEVKMKNCMLKMNEQLKKLNGLYEEYYDLEMTYNLSNLNDSSSIYDLFMTSLTSFNFLCRKFLENEAFENMNLLDCFEDYFKFIFNPNNDFLREINVLVDYDIDEVIASKYRLLNLNVTSEMINTDNIDSTLDTVSFINLVQNIEKSDTTVEKIKNLYEMRKIVSSNGENVELI